MLIYSFDFAASFAAGLADALGMARCCTSIGFKTGPLVFEWSGLGPKQPAVLFTQELTRNSSTVELTLAQPDRSSERV